MREMTRFAFGATAAIMTSMALIVGLGSANAGRSGVIGSLLVIAVADNLSDTLGIHIYEESRSGGTTAVRTSVSNYVTRLIVALSFVGLVLALPLDAARWASIVWGVALLSVLSYLIAKGRGAKPPREIATHLLVAAVVVLLSHALGRLIAMLVA